MRVAVFVSGRGSNLRAILKSQEERRKFEVSIVLSDKLDCPAFDIAKRFLIPTFSLGSKDECLHYSDLLEKLILFKIDLVVLAGFLKLIPKEIVSHFDKHIINIHPALLPSFGGKGMYGINVHKAVFESSAQVSGATIHFVDANYDTGKIIIQKCVDISDVKTPEEIAEKVLKIEHDILPYTIEKFAENKIRIIENRVVILE